MANRAKKGRKDEPEGQQTTGNSSEEELELETGDCFRAIEQQMAGMEAAITKLATALDDSSKQPATPTGRLKRLQGKSTGESVATLGRDRR